MLLPVVMPLTYRRPKYRSTVAVMQKLHVVAYEEELDRREFAISSSWCWMCCLLPRRWWPLFIVEPPRSFRLSTSAPPGRKRRDSRRIPRFSRASGTRGELIGFAPYSPLALMQWGVNGKRLIHCTTNGTVAIRLAAPASNVYVGALLNGRAIAESLLKRSGGETILLCSGSMGGFNLEDFYGAGHVAAMLTEAAPSRFRLSDSAIAARALFQSQAPEECLLRGRVGKLLVAIGLEDEVRFTARLDSCPIVPQLFDGRLRLSTAPTPSHEDA